MAIAEEKGSLSLKSRGAKRKEIAAQKKEKE